MNVNPLGMVSIALATVSFFGLFWRLRSEPRFRQVKWLVVLVFLSVPSMMVAVYYLHVLPEMEAFYEFRSWQGTELLAVFVGGLAGVLAKFLPRRLLVLPFLVMAGIVTVPHLKPLIGPMPDSTFQNVWNGAICMQSTPSTCGPASVATILRRFDIDASEMDVARAAYSYRRGTEAWYLARYVRRKGLRAKFRFEEKFSPDIELPAVAGVRVGAIGHFVAMLERNGDTYVIGDPLTGEEHLTKEELPNRYKFTGFYMSVSKD